MSRLEELHRLLGRVQTRRGRHTAEGGVRFSRFRSIFTQPCNAGECSYFKHTYCTLEHHDTHISGEFWEKKCFGI